MVVRERQVCRADGYGTVTGSLPGSAAASFQDTGIPGLPDGLVESPQGAGGGGIQKFEHADGEELPGLEIGDPFDGVGGIGGAFDVKLIAGGLAGAVEEGDGSWQHEAGFDGAEVGSGRWWQRT